MRKASKEPEPLRPHRRRARRRGANADTQDEDEIPDEVLRALYRHTVSKLMPRYCANLARKLGSPDIKPADFFCGCEFYFVSGLPICEGRRDNCRYAGLPPPDPVAHEQSKNGYLAMLRELVEARKAAGWDWRREIE